MPTHSFPPVANLHCFFTATGVPKDTLLERAEALKKMGKIFRVRGVWEEYSRACLCTLEPCGGRASCSKKSVICTFVCARENVWLVQLPRGSPYFCL